MRWTELRYAASRDVAAEENSSSQRIFLAWVRPFLVCLLVGVALGLWVLLPRSPVLLLAAVLVFLTALFVLGRRHAGSAVPPNP